MLLVLSALFYISHSTKEQRSVVLLDGLGVFL